MDGCPSSSIENKTSKCLICGEMTTAPHLGINSCRACAVFYRRSLANNRVYLCRSRSGQCKKRSKCRKCRFDKFQNIMESATMKESADKLKLPKLEPISMESPISNISNEFEFTPVHDPIYISATNDFDLPLISKIRYSYQLFCIIRRASELSTRSDDSLVHPTSAAQPNFPIIHSSFGHSTQYSQLFLTSIFDFASSAFDDFRLLDINRKWQIVRSAQEIIYVAEATYRGLVYYPDNHIIFGTYTTIMNPDNIELFFRDCDKRKEADAVTALRECLYENVKMCKGAMKRLNPTEEELMALYGLAFWNTALTNTDDAEVYEMGEKYQSGIISELSIFYKREGRTDFATRLGELFCVLLTCNKPTSAIMERSFIFQLLQLSNEPVF